MLLGYLLSTTDLAKKLKKMDTVIKIQRRIWNKIVQDKNGVLVLYTRARSIGKTDD